METKENEILEKIKQSIEQLQKLAEEAAQHSIYITIDANSKQNRCSIYVEKQSTLLSTNISFC